MLQTYKNSGIDDQKHGMWLHLKKKKSFKFLSAPYGQLRTAKDIL